MRLEHDATPLRDAAGQPDPTNAFAVAIRGGAAIIMRVVQPLERMDALRLTAWLTVLLEISDEEILAARRQVERT